MYLEDEIGAKAAKRETTR